MAYLPDISHHHPVKNWSSVASSCSFLISKATQRTNYTDPTLSSFIKNCEKHKIPYWLYTYLEKGNEKKQAEYMVKVCKDKVGSYFVGYILDVEAGNSASNVKSALDYLNGLGGKTMIYTMYAQYSKYKSVISGRGSNCAWWEARYGKNNGKYNSSYPCHSGADLHQYTSNGRVSGLSGSIDLNRICGSKSLSWFTSKSGTSVMAGSTIVQKPFEYKPPKKYKNRTNQIKFINDIGKLCAKHISGSGLQLLSPSIAQAYYESKYGTSNLGKNYHNYWGMKVGNWKGPKHGEYRAYSSMEEGVKGYYEFCQISKYKPLKSMTDPKEFMNQVGTLGWCPEGKYGGDVQEIWEQWDLKQWDNAIGMVGSGSYMNITVEFPRELIHETMDWYILTLDRNSPDVDWKKITEGEDKDIVGAVIEAGYYFDSKRKKVPHFRNPIVNTQVDKCIKYGIPWGFYTITRASTLQDVRNEMYELSFIFRNYPPKLGCWLVLDFPTDSKKVNDTLVDEWYRIFKDDMGFIDQVGFYVTQKQLDKITWSKHQDRWYLWLVNHVKKVEDIPQLLDPPFFDRPEEG